MMEFIPRYRNGAPDHTLYTSTSVYVALRPIKPKPPVARPKDVLHRFLFTGIRPPF